VAKWAVNFTGELGGGGLAVDVPIAIGGEPLAALHALGFSVNVVPEPAALPLLVAAGLFAARRRKR
jgi:hypothetical protein